MLLSAVRQLDNAVGCLELLGLGFGEQYYVRKGMVRIVLIFCYVALFLIPKFSSISSSARAMAG